MWILDLFRKRTSSRRARLSRPRLQLEALETRLVPYAVSGNSWIHPEMITISFMPDGTDLGGVTSNLFSKFNARFGSAAAWQNPILSAAQSWAQQTNINFEVVSDNGAGSGTGSYQQGDPGFGDIRIGGYSFSGNSLATAYYPQPINNYSIAGDFVFNSKLAFNINGLDYDLYTVALHEFGHVLGMAHSSDSFAVMYPTYGGVVYGLDADDTNGIRNIYSSNASRSADSYDAAASNGSFATATDVTAQINPVSQTALVNNLDITSTTDLDYYKFTALAGSSSLKVQIQSDNLSLLRPLFKVYNSSFVQIATVSGSGNTGNTISTTVSVTAGLVYYVMVDGVDNTWFGTGKYALALNFGTGATPTAPAPNTQTANGYPLSGGGGIADHIPHHRHRHQHLDEYSDSLDVARGYSVNQGSSPAAPGKGSSAHAGVPQTVPWDVSTVTSVASLLFAPAASADEPVSPDATGAVSWWSEQSGDPVSPTTDPSRSWRSASEASFAGQAQSATAGVPDDWTAALAAAFVLGGH